MDHLISTLPSSPSFVRVQAASLERRIRHHTKNLGGQKTSSVPPVPPLPSSSRHPRSPCLPRTVNLNPHAEQAAVLTSSPTPAKATAGSALPTRKGTVRKKPAPSVSPSLHAELHKTAKAKVSALPVSSARSRPTPERTEDWGINSSTLSLGLGITFDDDDNERAYELGQDIGQEDKLTGPVSRQSHPQVPFGSLPPVVPIDSTAPGTAVSAQGEASGGEVPYACGRFPTPLPSTTSDSYDLALLEVDRVFHARLELTLRQPGVEGEGSPFERPIRRGASSITLGRARSLRQPSIKAADASTRSASLNAPVRSSPNVSKWLANIESPTQPDGSPSAVDLEVEDLLKTSSSDRPACQRSAPETESAPRFKGGPVPAITRAPSFANLSLFRNKSISTLRRTLSRSRSSQKQPNRVSEAEEFSSITPERRDAASLKAPKGVNTPRRGQTPKRSRPQQRMWWEHAIVVVGAAGPGAFY